MVVYAYDVILCNCIAVRMLLYLVIIKWRTNLKHVVNEHYTGKQAGSTTGSSACKYFYANFNGSILGKTLLSEKKFSPQT